MLRRWTCCKQETNGTFLELVQLTGCKSALSHARADTHRMHPAPHTQHALAAWVRGTPLKAFPAYGMARASLVPHCAGTRGIAP